MFGRSLRTPVLTLLAVLAFEMRTGADASDLYRDQCRDKPGGDEKIKSCLSILNKVEGNLQSDIYDQVAHTYASELNNVDKAIEYQEKALNAFGTVPPKPNPKLFRNGEDLGIVVFYAQYSMRYFSLAAVEDMKSLILSKEGDLDEASRYARLTEGNYTKAIAINPLIHWAYGARAKLYARYCRSDEAARDARAAIEIAKLRDDKRAAAEYIGIDPNDCRYKNRGRLD